MDKVKILNIPTGGLFRDGISLSQLAYIKKINKKKFDIDIVCSNDPVLDLNEEFVNSGSRVIVLSNRKKKLLHYILD